MTTQTMNSAKLWDGAIWFGVLLLVMIGAAIALSRFRRKFVVSGETFTSGFSLEELRQLRDRGGLSNEEYESLRRRVVNAYTADSLKK